MASLSAAEELGALDGCAQAELIRRGELTAREVAEAAITRIEQRDRDVNAVVIKRYEQALDEADGSPPGAPLGGVPFLLKDLGPTLGGMPATLGSAMLVGFVPAHDGELVRRFRAAGLRILGKTSTAEFGVLPTTETALYGPTRNPHDLRRTAGGSSGGAAAAVAAGLVPIAHANDAGGSIRLPAGCCGVFGLKPTRARTPLGPDTGDLMNGLACEHVVTRTVRDSAAVLDAVAGPDVGDPYWAPPAAGTFAEAARYGTGRRLRIAFSTRDAVGRLDPECAAAVRDAAALCEKLGHDVTEDAPDAGFADAADDFLTLWAAGVSSAVMAFASLSGRTPAPGLLEETTWWLYERGRADGAADYLATVSRLQRLARRLARFHQDYDVLISACTAEPAPLLGVLSDGDPERQLRRALEFAYETPLANLTGQPAMSVPLGCTPGGLPIGVQFTGRFGDEATLLALAADLEDARPWSGAGAAARGHVD